MKIIVTLPVENRHKQLLEQQAADADFIYTEVEGLTKEQVHEAQIIIGKAPVPFLADSPNLKWIQLGSAGTDGYCTKGALPQGTLLTNATGAYGFAISEHMIGMLFMLRKKLHLYYRNQLQGQWKNEGQVTAVSGSTTVVLGLGDIGGEFAMRMKALGSYVIGVKRREGIKPDYVDELHLSQDLDKLLGRADVLAITLPGTEDTINLIGEERLRMMKPNAVIINVGRGKIIDNTALYEALKENRIGGAALDVTDPEPLTENHPLWKAPNTIITPHVSGGYFLPETFERIIRISAANLKKYMNQEPLDNIVDFQTGYRR